MFEDFYVMFDEEKRIGKSAKSLPMLVNG